MINVLNNVINNVKQTPARGSLGSENLDANDPIKYFVQYFSGVKTPSIFLRAAALLTHPKQGLIHKVRGSH